MSAPGSSRQQSQGDASLYETGAIQWLQHKVTRLETEIAGLGMNNANLRAEKIGLESSVMSLSMAIQTKDAHLSKLSGDLSLSQGRIAKAEAAAKDFEKKHKDVLQAFGVLKEVFDAQAAELKRLEMLNANMKTYIERTPAAPRGQSVTGGSPPPQQTTQMELAPSSVTRPFGTPIGYGHGAETTASGPSSALVVRNASSNQLTYQPVSDLASGPRAMPSFAVPPISRPVTIRRPDAPVPAVPAVPTTKLKGTPPGATPENMKYVQAFSNVFRSVERFAKTWVIRLGHTENITVPPIPTLLKQESAKYIEAFTLSYIWSKRNLRYSLIVRHLADDLVNNYWALSNIAPFSENVSVIARIQEIANLTNDRQVPLSSEHRSTLIIERAKLITSLDSQSPAYIQTNATAHAIKIHTRLEKILSQDRQCITDLTNIYVMAGKIFFFIWGNPYDWHFAFPPGGRMSFWNPATCEVENEELKGKTTAEIKAMDQRVVLSTTPVITRIGYSGRATVPSCVCLASTLVSRDGVRLNQ